MDQGKNTEQYSEIFLFEQAVIGDDSHLHLLSANGACRRIVNLWEKSYVAMASHDLSSQSRGLELVVASQDGTVVCLGQMSTSEKVQGTELVDPSLTWSSELEDHNDFTYLPSQVCTRVPCALFANSKECHMYMPG